MRIKTACGLAALFLTLLPALAQAQEAVHPLAWEECVAIAKKNNPDLAASSYSVEAGKAS